jgi:hypothetical protein
MKKSGFKDRVERYSTFKPWTDGIKQLVLRVVKEMRIRTVAAQTLGFCLPQYEFV